MRHSLIQSRGFSLIEMAIVLLIMGVILGSGMSLVASQVEQQQLRDTQKILEEAKEALLGYAANQTPPHLPCPDKNGGAGAGTANDGLEDVTAATGQCVAQSGNLPWATLALAQVDAWGNRLHYSVNGAFSSRAPAASFTLSSVATLRACQAAGCAVVLANGVPAVILSYGKNGFGAITAAGAMRPAPTSADELENTDGNNNFVSRNPSASGAAMGEFDDFVTWRPTGMLFNRMLQSGKLP